MPKEKMGKPSNLNVILWELLRLSFNAMVKARQKELDRYDVTLPESAVLRVVLRLRKRATPTEISKQLFLEVHSISEQLKRMEADGLIKRTNDLDKKNLVRIQVTEKGYKLYRKTRNQRTIDYIMSVLTEEEKHALWTIIAKLREQAIKKLDINNMDLYPPADYTEIWPPEKQ
jgi:DNA-binding MarR family transcriptional regulator